MDADDEEILFSSTMQHSHLHYKLWLWFHLASCVSSLYHGDRLRASPYVDTIQLLVLVYLPLECVQQKTKPYLDEENIGSSQRTPKLLHYQYPGVHAYTLPATTTFAMLPYLSSSKLTPRPQFLTKSPQHERRRYTQPECYESQQTISPSKI